MGKLDEAEAKLKLALKEYPHNEAALYYLNLVGEARFARANPNSIKRELLPVPNPYGHTTEVRTSPGRQAVITKLNRIRFDSVSFDGLPLGEVLHNLVGETRKRDPEKLGINFIITSPDPVKAAWEATLDPLSEPPKPATSAKAVDPSSIVITLKIP